MEKESAKSVNETSPNPAEPFFIKMPNAPLISSADAMRIEKELLDRLKSRGPRGSTLKPLAIFYSRVGQQETAYRHLKTWMKHTKNSEELAECLLMCGQLAEQVDQPKSAIAFYHEGLQVGAADPQVNYYLHNNLGYCLGNEAEYEQARHHCEAAIKLDATRSNAYKNLGLCHQGLGRYGEAATAWIQALHTDASDPRPLELLEKLFVHQSEVLERDIPDIRRKLDACRHALATAKTGRFADWARGLTLN
jgi:tetratricopeptide (TPR) repeat protein